MVAGDVGNVAAAAAAVGDGAEVAVDYGPEVAVVFETGRVVGALQAWVSSLGCDRHTRACCRQDECPSHPFPCRSRWSDESFPSWDI